MSDANPFGGTFWPAPSEPDCLKACDQGSVGVDACESSPPSQTHQVMNLGAQDFSSLFPAMARSDRHFKYEWAAYLAACQARKQRIATAQRVYLAEMSAAKDRLNQALAEAVPTQPMKK